MAITFKCPKCQKLLSVEDEFANQQVRCSDCLTLLIAPPPLPPPPPPPPAPPAPPQSVLDKTPFIGMGDDPNFVLVPTPEVRNPDWAGVGNKESRIAPLGSGWQQVQNGLTIMHYGNMVWIATAALQMLIAGLILTGAVSPRIGQFVLLVPFPLWPVGLVMVLVGEYFCTAVPVETNLQRTIWAAGLCTLGILTIPAGGILLLLFMRGVASQFDNRQLSRRILVFLIFAVASLLALGSLVVVLIPLMFFLGGKDARETIVTLMQILAFGWLITMFFWYLVLLGGTRTTIERARLGRVGE